MYLIFGLVIVVLMSGCAQKISEIEKLPKETSVVTEADSQEDTRSPEAGEYQQDWGIYDQVTWYFDTEWKVEGNPSLCPEPFILQTPIDTNLATSVLYPGQLRSGNYKPHGGFRFDHSENEDITVKAPVDGVLVRGSRYIESGEIQYMFDIINPCGIMVRFDHLLALSPKFADAAEQLRQPVADDSRTTPLDPIPIRAGEVVATAVGLKKTERSVGVDWGVYDLRQKNQASKNPEWLLQHPGEQAPYALCWLDLLPPEDSTKLKSLPGGDYISGKQSDYCK